MDSIFEEDRLERLAYYESFEDESYLEMKKQVGKISEKGATRASNFISNDLSSLKKSITQQKKTSLWNSPVHETIATSPIASRTSLKSDNPSKGPVKKVMTKAEEKALENEILDII